MHPNDYGREDESVKNEHAKFTVLAVIHDLLVEVVEVLRVPWERSRVASHGVPGSDGEDVALVILTHEVLQYGGVVDEGVQLVVFHGLKALLYGAPV